MRLRSGSCSLRILICQSALHCGAPLNEWKSELFYSGGAEGYADYPSLVAAGA